MKPISSESDRTDPVKHWCSMPKVRIGGRAFKNERIKRGMPQKIEPPAVARDPTFFVMNESHLQEARRLLMPEITIFSTETCPKCRALEAFLDGLKVDYKARDMTLPASIADLRCMGYFGLSAPVLKVGEEPIGPDQLFDGDLLQKDVVRAALRI